MLVLNAKRLNLYLIEVCLLVVIFPAADGIKRERERKRTRESFVSCPHPKCQCKPAKNGEVIARCVKVSETLPEFIGLNVTFAELILSERNLTELPENGFRGVRAGVLDLGSNPLRKERISNMAFAGLENVLHTLWLSDCGLSEVPAPTLSILKKLKVLHVEENILQEIPARFLSGNPQLQELYLNRNRIKSISLDAFLELTSLKHLKLGQNQLQNLPAKLFKFLLNLTSLDLSQNFLHSIVPGTFDGLRSLRWLELESNMIGSLTRDTFRGARKLKNMKIENNQLSSIADNTFRAINKLGYLSIDIANVTVLTSNTFGGLGRLETVSIGEILQSQLPDGLFSAMRSLRRLSLSDNMGKFTGLRKGIFADKFSFKNLSVFVNPIRNCRCNESWIKNMTNLGAYVHGFCSDNRPLSCTNKAGLTGLTTDKSSKNANVELKNLNIKESKRQTVRMRTVGP